MNKLLTFAGTIAGIVFSYASYLYFSTPVNTLPYFMPGYDAAVTGIYYIHGVVMFVLGIAAFIFASFNSKKRSEY